MFINQGFANSHILDDIPTDINRLTLLGYSLSAMLAMAWHGKTHRR